MHLCKGEALAVAWCLRKASLFLLGCPNLTLVTDHKPLVKLFGQNKELKDILNPRLLAMKKKTLSYNFKVKYLPGKKNPADFFSRYPALRAVPDCRVIRSNINRTIYIDWFGQNHDH